MTYAVLEYLEFSLLKTLPSYFTMFYGPHLNFEYNLSIMMSKYAMYLLNFIDKNVILCNNLHIISRSPLKA